jgi:putative ABC transport system substrate-binding protein
MNRNQRRQFLLAVAAVAAWPLTGLAQQQGKAPAIGLLDAGGRSELWAAFRQRLRDLGYIEGRNISFESRSAKDAFDLLPAMAHDLVHLNVAVIVTSGTVAAQAARRATARIPIVMATGTDQVSLGLAASLRRPGGNVTGLATLTSDLTTKRFELLREIVPKIARLAVLWHTENTPSMASVRDLEHATSKSKIAFQSLGVSNAEELADAFAAMTRERADAMVVAQSPLMFDQRVKISELALKHRIPGVFGASEFVDAGGLASFAPNYADLFRHAAIYVDKILKGANPGDLPIEQPTKFELIINRKTATALGIKIPQSILLRAERVIE